MGEVMLGVAVKGTADEVSGRRNTLFAELRDQGWEDRDRGNFYIDRAGLNSVPEVIAYLKNLKDYAGDPLLTSGDKVTIRVLGPGGGKGRYQVP